MSRGLYTAASGMFAGMERQVALANALANVSTPGYKSDVVALRSFPSVLLRAQDSGQLSRRFGALGSGVVLEHQGVNLSAGTITPTDYELDVAIDGAGFFVVRDDRGNERLTRDGQFSRSASGALVTSGGFELLSTDNTPIVIGGAPPTIGHDGTVQAGGQVVGRLRMVDASSGDLLRAGSSTFVVAEGTVLAEGSGQLIQGSVEGSNVNTTEVLTQMVGGARAYESAQRIFAMQNRILGMAASELGRV